MTRSDEEPFGRWLARQLKMRRMSQRQLAARSGVDHSTISRLIHTQRQPSLGTAARIARVLQDPGDSLDRRPLPTPSHPVDPVRGVEHALRADDRLSEAQVRRLMHQYLSERQSGLRPRGAIREESIPRREDAQREPPPWVERGPR